MIASHEFVRAIITDPGVWTHVCEDYNVPADYRPDPDAIYFQHGEWGFMEFRVASPHWAQVHIAMRRGASGVREFVFEAMATMRARGIKRFTAFIPETNRAPAILAYRCGYTLDGRIRGAFLKNGKLVDLLVMGAE